jgi:hypothetical protein
MDAAGPNCLGEEKRGRCATEGMADNSKSKKFALTHVASKHALKQTFRFSAILITLRPMKSA